MYSNNNKLSYINFACCDMWTIAIDIATYNYVCCMKPSNIKYRSANNSILYMALWYILAVSYIN